MNRQSKPSASGTRLKCPICELSIVDLTLKSLPFCSERCRLIDLGRWLDEQHAVPCEEPDEDDVDLPTPVQTDSETERRPVRLPPGWHDA